MYYSQNGTVGVCTLCDFSQNTVLLILRKMKIFDLLAKFKTNLASSARVDTLVLFANFSGAALCKNLLGNIPNPSTIFSKSATLLRS